MATFRPVCAVADLPPGQGRLVEIDGKAIALFNADGRFHAVDDTCLHAGGPLHEGTLDGTTVTCPWHDWRFDVATGRCAMSPTAILRRYATRVQGGVVEIEV